MRIFSAFRRAPELALATLARFPVVILAGAFLSWVIIDEPHRGEGERLMLTALLAIITAFDLSLVRERLRVGAVAGHFSVLALGAAALIALYMSIDLVPNPYGYGANRTRMPDDWPIRLAAIAVGLHALAAVIPFIGRTGIAGFWQYNRQLFLRALSSALFAGVLYAGLAVALWALDELLGVYVGDHAYVDLFAVMAGVVATWFFLVGVPKADEAWLEDDYPRGLKVFVQFVLLPLTAVYLVILYLYVGKIIVEWELPVGKVSYLIFSYAVIGILAYLLIFPLRDEGPNRWVRTFARGFFAALAPLIVVLAIALLRRVNDYGLTESRYYGLVLAGWLAVVTVYFLTRREDIRFIPLTLAVGALLTIGGPWGATAVAVRSQAARIESIAQRPKPYGEELQETVRSIARFLEQRGELEAGAASVTQRPDTVSSARELVELFDVDAEYLGPDENSRYHSFDRERSIDVDGFTDVIEVAEPQDSFSFSSRRIGQITVDLIPPGILSIRTTTDSLAIRLDRVLASLEAAPVPDRPMPPTESMERPPPEVMPKHGTGIAAPRIEAQSASGLKARLRLNHVTGTVTSDTSARVSAFSGTLLLGLRQLPAALDTARR